MNDPDDRCRELERMVENIETLSDATRYAIKPRNAVLAGELTSDEPGGYANGSRGGVVSSTGR